MKIHTLALITLFIMFTSVHAGTNLFFSDEFLIKNFNKRSDVQMHVGGVKKKYKVLQKVSVNLQKGNPQYGGYRGLSDVMHVLSSQAKALGGHAVIQFKFKDVPFNLISYGSIGGSGIAIRYLNAPPPKKKSKKKPKRRRSSTEAAVDR